MKKFKDLINKRLEEISAETKAFELIKMLEEFGMEKRFVREDGGILYEQPKHPFDFGICVWISVQKRQVSVDLCDAKDNYKEYIYSFANYTAKEIFDEIVKLVKTEINKAT